MPKTFTHAQARRFYDRLGSGQDTQAAYEAPALELLIRHGAFAEASAVAEFGAGTGRLAARLLAHELPATAHYWAFDLSPRMVGLATTRLARFGERVQVHQTDGPIRLPLPAQSVDRVLTTYVLDLLAPDDLAAFATEARRVLRPGGLLAMASLTVAYTPGARLVQRLWNAAYRIHPSIVGGCRPIELAPLFPSGDWMTVFADRTTRIAMPSQVLVLRAR